jgi:hypothetical protein
MSLSTAGGKFAPIRRKRSSVPSPNCRPICSELARQFGALAKTGSSYSRRQVRTPFAASALANLPPKSCARVNKLLVRLIRGKSWKRSPQAGQEFLAGRSS